jgi:hypothetical protein
MARYIFQGTFRDGQGNIIPDGTVTVFNAGTTTASTLYTASSGGTSVNSVTSDDNGFFYFYIDSSDYAENSQFDITLSKSGYSDKTYEDVVVYGKGADGSAGAPGADGACVESVAWSTDDMVFTLDDASTVTLANAKVDLAGADGSSGRDFICSLAATVGSKALTVAIKGVDGNDPSATNIVSIPFRSATLTTGTPVTRDITSPLSIVLSSGSTLGFTAAVAGRIYVWAIDDEGTVVLGLSRTADIFSESNLISTTAEGGAGAADSATVMYSTAAQTNKACRCLGYVEITTGATAGEWDNAPSKVQNMGLGVHRTGDVIQVQYNQISAFAVGPPVSGIALDDSIPQSGEGGEFITLAITPTSATNKLIIEHSGHYGAGNINCLMVVALFQDNITNALASVTHSFGGTPNYGIAPMTLAHHMAAGTTVSTTFKIRAGTNTGDAVTINGVVDASGRGLGGVASTWLRITEVFA